MDRDAPNLVHVGRQQGRPALLGLFVGGCLSMALVNLDHAIFRAFPSYLLQKDTNAWIAMRLLRGVHLQ